MSENNETRQDKFTPIEQHLFNSRTIFMNGAVGSELAATVNSQLLAMEQDNPEKPIVLWINSPGGEVQSGFSIYDTIQFIKPKVITLVAGMAASMGSIVALAADKENRLSLPNAKVLIHQPLVGGVIRGQASDIEIHAKDIIELKKKLHKLYADRTGSDISIYEQKMERDHWLEAQEALELGIISKIIKNREELESLI